MAKIYYKRIKAGLMTIEDVPDKWRKAVEEMLEKDGQEDK
ncbi:CD1375 family protein [Bilifractor sp. LCP19S3_H10]